MKPYSPIEEQISEDLHRAVEGLPLPDLPHRKIRRARRVRRGRIAASAVILASVTGGVAATVIAGMAEPPGARTVIAAGQPGDSDVTPRPTLTQVTNARAGLVRPSLTPFPDGVLVMGASSPGVVDGEPPGPPASPIAYIVTPEGEIRDVDGGPSKAVRGQATTWIDGRIVLVGGSDGSQPTKTAWSYDPAADSWVSLPSLPEPRMSGTAVAADGQIVVAGGKTSTTPNPAEIYVGDGTRPWRTVVASHPVSGLVVTRNGVVYAYGFLDTGDAFALSRVDIEEDTAIRSDDLAVPPDQIDTYAIAADGERIVLVAEDGSDYRVWGFRADRWESLSTHAGPSAGLSAHRGSTDSLASALIVGDRLWATRASGRGFTSIGLEGDEAVHLEEIGAPCSDGSTIASASQLVIWRPDSCAPSGVWVDAFPTR